MSQRYDQSTKLVGRNALTWVIGVVWFAGIVCGMWVWERYETTPGSVGANMAAAAEREKGDWRLAVFVHPYCPCSRATMVELQEIARAAPRLKIQVWFVWPEEESDAWKQGELWTTANRIARFDARSDAGGVEANRFGAETSGQAVLTSPQGTIVFRGGLTRARGHEGESVGRRAVLAWIAGQPAPDQCPVFGCPLFTPTE